ncbi:MAG TPA: single-stranded DNA-binding protein [Candidatus Binatia bacterium]|nr:single-stranded DNA-binding protein [Candidatus Binatia bacterium]
MINRVILIGNLTKDAESLPSSGKPMTRIRLATNSGWRDAAGNRQEETEYHSVIAFGSW